MDGMQLGDIIPELVLLGGGVVVLLYSLFVPIRWHIGAGLLALTTALVAAGTGLQMLGDPGGYTFFATYATDGAAVWAKLIVLTATAAVVALSIPWFRSDPRGGEYYTLLLFSALGAILLAGATDLMEVVVAILLSSASGYVLAGFHRRSRVASEAAIKYFLLGALTSAGMLMGVALLFGLAGTTTFPGMQGSLRPGPALVGGAALVVAALAFKMGAVPVHQWMPDIAEGAPAPVAAFITSAPKVGGLIALARLALVLPQNGVGWRPLVGLLAATTMTLGNLAALWQDDVRRLLGWSAVSQTGYGLMGVVALTRSDLAVASILFFLAAYMLGNVAAFGVVVELRGRTALEDYGGLARVHPWLAAALVVAFLSFIGIPPLAGFGAKLALFAATIDAGYAWLAALAVANTVVSIAYYARVIAPMYFHELPVRRPAPVLGAWAAAATFVCAAGVVVAGVGAEPLMSAFMAATLLP